MFPDLWEYASYFRSLINQIWDSVDLKLASCEWQFTGAITAAAMAVEVDQPDGKPRPPSGGKTYSKLQTLTSSSRGGFSNSIVPTEDVE